MNEKSILRCIILLIMIILESMGANQKNFTSSEIILIRYVSSGHWLIDTSVCSSNPHFICEMIY